MEENKLNSSEPANVDMDSLCEILDNVKIPAEAVVTIPTFPGFEKFEGHMNWIFDSDKFTHSDIQTIINVVADKVNDNTQDGDATLKYFGIESVCYRAALAFLSALVGQHNDSQKHLIAAIGDIQRIKELEFVQEDYLDGLRYVLKGLNAYNYLLKRRQEWQESGLSDDENEIVSVTGNLDKFDDLCTKSQVGVMAMKHYFDGQLRRPHEPQIGFVKQMIEKDPENYLWHFNLYSLYRFQRREKESPNHTPIDDEIKAINRAVQLAPDHPLVLVGDCVCLAETMRSTSGQQEMSWRKGLTYGEREFKSMQAVVDTIKINTKKILDAHQENVRINIHISECFYVILPQEYRDLEFAKQCVERALEFHPKSSKALHRMGSLVLNSPNCDMNEVIKWYDNAVSCDSRNFPAKAALLRALMSSPADNYDRINTLLIQELANDEWNNSRKAELYFLRGCFFLLTHGEDHPGNNILAAQSWLSASELSTETLNFISMYKTAKRFNWPQRKLSYATALNAIEALDQAGLSGDSSVVHVKKIRQTLQKLKEAATLHYQQQQQAKGIMARGGNRGGGRGGRQLTRRNTDDASFYANGSNNNNNNNDNNSSNGKEKWSRVDTRPERIRRCSNSQSEGAKVIVIRQPKPPNGPGFSQRPRQLSLSES